MTKVKNMLYEHRFSLVFFGLLVCFGLVLTDPMRIIDANGVTYSFYCVDFSLGFCTKLLPGAIYNLLVGKYDEVSVTIYVKVLIVFALFIISCLFEKILKKNKSDNQKEIFFFLCFSVSTVYFFFFEAGLVYLLDFHWIIAALIFLICISNKKLYIFIPLSFLYALMTHYVSVICYVAVCLLVMIYKAYKTKEKKERYFLFGIFAVSVVLSVTVFLYMLFFELENVKLSYPQFRSLLESRGVGGTDYYIFAFFRDAVEDIFDYLYTDETEGLILNIDPNQSPFKILIQTVIQQLRINLYLSDHKDNLPQVLVFVPGICAMMGGIISKIKDTKFFEKLMYSAGIILFIFICAFSLLFSTDTLRWIGNAVLTFTIFYLFVMCYDEKDKSKTLSVAARLPDGVYYFYLALCFLFPLI